jgi:hypothetical protein
VSHPFLPAERLHFAWDNTLPPLLEIEPATKLGVGHALTGPIAMR